MTIPVLHPSLPAFPTVNPNQDAVRVPLAGLVEVVAFDKTGTLTEPGMKVHSVLPASGPTSMGQALVVKPDDAPPLFKVMGAKLAWGSTDHSGHAHRVVVVCCF